jgi:3-oxoacyl-[acyl-carrier-protein] synthase II
MEVLTPLGEGAPAVLDAMLEGRSGIGNIEEWEGIEGLRTRVGGRATADGFKDIPRPLRRSMGRVSLLAVRAARSMIEQAGIPEDLLRNGDTGVSFGSTMGGVEELTRFFDGYFHDRGVTSLTSNTFLKFMSHTCAANVALALGCGGRIIAPCSACASGSQSIGFAFESIRDGRAKAMVCGGAEELHFLTAGVFDRLLAASTRYNDQPHRTPRPFDRDRDGVVCSEGAGVVMLEERESAISRGARPIAELVGYGTTTDGTHMTNPSMGGMARAAALAVEDAGIDASRVDYVNAHATGTPVGDEAESAMIREVYSSEVPVSSPKGHLGHGLGACGAVEAILAVEMMNRGVIAPTLNLDNVDDACSGVNHVLEPARCAMDVVASHSFAFGGINSVLVFKRHDA